MNQLPSAFQIGDPVRVEIQNQNLYGHVRTIIFTNSKVRYGIRITLSDEPEEDNWTTLHNIDSYFVHEDPTGEPKLWAPDNYS